MCSHNFQVFLLLVYVVPLCSPNTASVSLTVHEPNDYTPEFHSAISHFNISQGDYADQPLILTQVEALDEDAGSSGNVTYNLTGATPPGALDKFSITEDGQLSLKALATVGDLYVLVVEASDHGSVPRRDHTVFVISVVSDWADGPKLPTDMYHVRVSEGIRPHSHLVRVQALDPHVEVHYTIAGGNDDGAFSINEKTGVIRTAKLLNVSVQDEYLLTVTASDPDGKNAFAKVEIRVSPNMEHRVPNCNCTALNSTCTPVTSELYIAHVPENITLNSVVFAMPTTEQTNETTDTMFAITDGNAGGEFSINDITGEVSVVKTLNYTENSMYDLTITATIPGGKLTATTLRVLLSPASAGLHNDEGGNVLYTNEGRDVVYTGQCQCPNASPRNLAVFSLLLSFLALPYLV